MHKQKSVYSQKNAFTLIELVMTIVVLGIISIPLSFAVSANIQSVFLSEFRTSAMHWARFDIERVKNMAYDNIVNASWTNFLGSGYNITRTVTFVQGDATSAESLKKIVVEVNKQGDTKVLARMAMYSAKNVSFGI
jgi:prepilin-type N-terminal cleavage/methylation domain-containing protein